MPKKGKGGLGKAETAGGQTNASRVPKKKKGKGGLGKTNASRAPKKGKGGLGKTETAGGNTNASRVLPKKGKGVLGKTDSSLQLATPLARKSEPESPSPTRYKEEWHNPDVYMEMQHNHDECIMERELELKYIRLRILQGLA